MGDLHGADGDAMRRILLHEARVHALPGRDLRDLGDATLLHDPDDPDPFWNRLEIIRWPTAPAAFDRRLDEATVLFATLGRRPHIWPSPAFDEPTDLVARLMANGYEDLGAGQVMVVVDERLVAAGATAVPAGVTLEVLSDLAGAEAERAARDVVSVLCDAFGVQPDAAPRIEAETRVTLGRAGFAHHLVRVDGQPAAVARSATFDGLSYLSSIGTAAWARGRGLGGLATAAAAARAVASGSEWTFLGVFAENTRAIRLYERVGFAVLGEPGPDLLLVG
jgi:GNAT superfamily N-acetyltransferase